MGSRKISDKDRSSYDKRRRPLIDRGGLNSIDLDFVNGIVVADIPGLIEGAHRGAGLGHEFLRHIDRTRVLIHLVDLAAPDPESAVTTVTRELEQYAPGLAARPTIVVGNKIDLPEARARADGFVAAHSAAGLPALAISAATGEGVPALITTLVRLLRTSPPAGTGPRDAGTPPEEEVGAAENTAPNAVASSRTTEQRGRTRRVAKARRDAAGGGRG